MATDVDQKLLKQTKFPTEFNQKVDMQKVNLEVLKKWIAGKISDILNNEDDVVIELCFNLLEGSRFPNIKVLQIQLGGFLGQPTAGFCKELWSLCLSAQSNPQGVPKELLEAKKLELIEEKIQAERAAEAAQRRKEEETAKEKDLDSIRQRERTERGGERGQDRGRGRGRGNGRGATDSRLHGARNDRTDPQDRRRENWSPPSKRRGKATHRENPSRREMDTYIPSNRRQRSNSRPRRVPPHLEMQISEAWIDIRPTGSAPVRGDVDEAPLSRVDEVMNAPIDDKPTGLAPRRTKQGVAEKDHSRYHLAVRQLAEGGE
ncbi:MAG: hypothetical protein M1831_000368 [Alyxoria varia]|nr:MAG: hypothetical protein M1831_000368 [Alyxoria varia]